MYIIYYFDGGPILTIFLSIIMACTCAAIIGVYVHVGGSNSEASTLLQPCHNLATNYWDILTVNFARIIPDGVLVFFPSYPVMQSCWQSWIVSSTCFVQFHWPFCITS